MCRSLTLMDAPMVGRTDVGADRTARGACAGEGEAAVGRWLRAAPRPELRPRGGGEHEPGRKSQPSMHGAQRCAFATTRGPKRALGVWKVNQGGRR